MHERFCIKSMLWIVFPIFFVLLAPVAWGACGGISGKVVNSSATPIASVTVKVYHAANRVEIASAVTNASGNYSVTGLPGGNYKLRFQYLSSTYPNGYQSQWYGNKADFDSANSVLVSDNTTTSNINATLVVGGRISGTVKDGSGTGLIGIRVNVYDANHTNIGSAKTGINGAYYVNGLPSGSYKVNFDRSSSACGNTIWYSGKPDFSTATAVTVTSGSETAGIDATLPSGSIVGAVRDNDTHVGLDSVYIHAYDVINGNYAGSAMTDFSGTGAYVLAGLSPGNYNLFFYNFSGYVSMLYNSVFTTNGATLVAVTDGQTVTVNQDLPIGATISGTVTDSNGDPIEGVDVFAYVNGSGEDDEFSVYATTESDGTYTLMGLRSGVAYKINFSGSDIGYIDEWYNDQESIDTADTVTSTIATPAVNIDAVLADGGSITGKLLGACGPVEGIMIDATDATDAYFYDLSASDGTFTLTGLASKTYTVSIGFSDFYAHTSRTVAVSAPDTTMMPDVTLSIGGSISGRVTDSSGWGLESVEVDIYDGSGNFITYTETNANGYYVARGLPTGSFKVAFYAGCLNIEQWYNNQALVAVTAPSGTTGINTTLSGTITTATLTISLTGSGTVTGSGTRNGVPVGFSTNVNVVKQFDIDTTVNISAAAAEYSLFSGWTGACTGTAGCPSIYMTSDKSVGAVFNFDTAHKTRIGDTSIYRETLQAAYNDAPNPGTVKAWGMDYNENLLLNLPKNLTLKGGYNQAYTANNSYTRLVGKVAIRAGSLIVEKLRIR